MNLGEVDRKKPGELLKMTCQYSTSANEKVTLSNRHLHFYTSLHATPTQGNCGKW